MKFIIIGSTQGNIDIVNQYLEKTDADCALCTGDFGIFYRTATLKSLPKSFHSNNFYEYIEGKKKFIKPVISVRGAHDNLSLCKTLYDGDIQIDNFSLLDNGQKTDIPNPDYATDSIPIRDITVGGIGGSYSPNHYKSDSLIGNARRHFTEKETLCLREFPDVNILLMHDLIGGRTKKNVMFSEETYKLLETVNPLYCFAGGYDWWASSKLSNVNFVLLPYASKGYLVVDTNEWNAEGVTVDLVVNTQPEKK